MNELEFLILCKKTVAQYVNEQLNKTDNKSISEDDVFVVWCCDSPQNNKALLSTKLFDGMYYELNYIGDNNGLYLDAYKKIGKRIHQTLDDIYDFKRAEVVNREEQGMKTTTEHSLYFNTAGPAIRHLKEQCVDVSKLYPKPETGQSCEVTAIDENVLGEVNVIQLNKEKYIGSYINLGCDLGEESISSLKSLLDTNSF